MADHPAAQTHVGLHDHAIGRPGQALVGCRCGYPQLVPLNQGQRNQAAAKRSLDLDDNRLQQRPQVEDGVRALPHLDHQTHPVGMPHGILVQASVVDGDSHLAADGHEDAPVGR